jgi:hypothetical protein
MIKLWKNTDGLPVVFIGNDEKHMTVSFRSKWHGIRKLNAMRNITHVVLGFIVIMIRKKNNSVFVSNCYARKEYNIGTCYTKPKHRYNFSKR